MRWLISLVILPLNYTSTTSRRQLLYIYINILINLPDSLMIFLSGWSLRWLPMLLFWCDLNLLRKLIMIKIRVTLLKSWMKLNVLIDLLVSLNLLFFTLFTLLILFWIANYFNFGFFVWVLLLILEPLILPLLQHLLLNQRLQSWLLTLN